MKNLMPLMVLALIVLMGCAKEETNELTLTNDTVSSLDNDGEATARKSRPFKGTIVYTPNDNNISCSCPVGQGQGEFTGSGNLTHLGLTASDTDVCNTPAACGGFSVSSQCAVFTAANGDELNGTVSEPYDNCFDPECGCLIGEALIDFSGGTGRFEDASGQATVVVTTTVDQFFNVVSVSSVFDGTIDY